VQADFNPANITNAISLLAALSVATERLVEIVKGAIPWLNNENQNPTLEGWRQAVLHLLAAFSGFVTAWMASATFANILPGSWNRWAGYSLIGLLVSGGSGFWNSILSYAKASKDVQESKTSGNQIAAQ
jgi:drug/metabolite transporter (DMT)-like permease